jgi:hypothetical protein
MQIVDELFNLKHIYLSLHSEGLLLVDPGPIAPAIICGAALVSSKAP